MRNYRPLLLIVLLISQLCFPIFALAYEEPSYSALRLQGNQEGALGQEMRLQALINDGTAPVYMSVPEGIDFVQAETLQPELVQIEWDKGSRLLTIVPQVERETELVLAEPELFSAQITLSLIPQQSGTFSFQLTSEGKQSEVFVLVIPEEEVVEETEETEFLEETLESEEMVTEMSEQPLELEQPQEPKVAEVEKTVRATGEADAANWADFAKAIMDTSVNKINLTASFSNPRTAGEGDPNNVATYLLKRSLEINGNGHRVDFQGSSINLGDPGSDRPTFHLHDVILAQRYAGGYSEDIVGSRLAAHSGKWHYRFGNITTEPSVQRLARAQYAGITLYGQMTIDTRAENFYVGSLQMEEGTVYRGNVNYYDFSIFYYNLAARTTDTGYTQEFTVGADSDVFLSQSQKGGTTYPAVFYHYKTITIGEGATYNVNMPGNAVRFNFNTSEMVVKANATVNLRNGSTTTSVINFAVSDTRFVSEAGASITIIGKGSTESAVNLSNANGPTNTTFRLTAPRYFDIRNLGGQTTSRAISLGTTNRATNTFEVTDGDLSLWYTASDIQGPPTYSYEGVAQLLVTGSGSMQKVVSDNSQLQTKFISSSISRITSVKHQPTVEFEEVTDAHLTIKARVKLGEIPDDHGANGEGEVTTTPIYASEGQFQGYIEDTYGIQHDDLWTDSQGYFSYRDTRFNLADKAITVGLVIDASKTLTFETLIKDVTPPEPAYELQGAAPESQELTGKAAEIGAQVTYQLNEKLVTAQNGEPISGEVQEDGSWRVAVKDLVLGDVIQVFLTDKAGNTNPLADTPFIDALFKQGTTIVVKGGELMFISAPSSFSFGQELAIGSQAMNYPLQQLVGSLVVQDTRSEKQPFSLSAKMGQRLKSASGAELIDAIVYRSQGKETVIDQESVELYHQTAQDDQPIDLSTDWLGQQAGLNLKTQPGKVNAETYQGTIEWTLRDVPGND
ncbi:cell surface protein [Vagococcus sp. BWB3-3]|uniref:Cell surface protein n=1 Tax=Vagococcus allomyrinae TaxID=2794353 RepID=A0A940P2V4_9ENTE|nr:pectate lyase-like adhesive domain-containing protein [Vagococcus allomyrinae]MBP1040025.1 cell surface protein [Vagococcus allomyrinae]